MNVLKRAVMVAVALIAFDTAEAQYTFSAQIVISGKCFSQASSMAERNIRQVVNEVNAKLKAVPLTKAECMAMSQQFAGELAVYSFSEYGCSIKLVITPCICTGCQEEASSPDQGGSFNSANAGSEVNDWADDVDVRRRALDPSQVDEMFGGGTGDKQFDDALKKGLGAFELPNIKVEKPDDFELLANMENVQRYINSSYDLTKMYMDYTPDLTMMLRNEFQRISKFDVNAIINMEPSKRSDAEVQALYDYQAYSKLMLEKMANEIHALAYELATREETRTHEMAALSEDCYGDSKHEYITETNYIGVGSDFFNDNNSPMKGLLELIGECNATTNETGFHAELYYNKVTGEYTIAFEGTNFKEQADRAADIMIGINEIPEQHNLAMRIANYINNLNLPENVSINITGHSLGGSLASVVGMATGLPTYTYNAAGVNPAMIEKYGLGDKLMNNDIKAYRTYFDPITSMQEGLLKPIVVGTVIDVVSIVNPIEGAKLAIESAKGNTASPAVGKKQTIDSASGHSIHNMVNSLGMQRSFENIRYNNLEYSIRRALSEGTQQIEDHILIVWPE